MQTTVGDATAVATERLERCFSGPECDWTRFYKPKNRRPWGAGINLFTRRWGISLSSNETQARLTSFGRNLTQSIEACLMIDPGSTDMPPGKEIGLGHFRKET